MPYDRSHTVAIFKQGFDTVEEDITIGKTDIQKRKGFAAQAGEPRGQGLFRFAAVANRVKHFFCHKSASFQKQSAVSDQQNKENSRYFQRFLVFTES
jgi:hypothetical protein